MLSKYVAHLDDPAIDWEYEYSEGRVKAVAGLVRLDKRAFAGDAGAVPGVSGDNPRNRKRFCRRHAIKLRSTPPLECAIRSHSCWLKKRLVFWTVAWKRTREHRGKTWRVGSSTSHSDLRIEQGQIPKPPPRIISGSPRRTPTVLVSESVNVGPRVQSKKALNRDVEFRIASECLNRLVD